MSSEKPNFLSQPVVKNVFIFRNGDPYYEARRIVINEKRVCNFETLLREVTGGIQAPFGAVRNIYTPRGGHKVDCLEDLQSGEQYVAAGKERFKKLDYLQIGSRKKRMMQTLPVQAKPLPQNRIIVSARFLKPIKEPCTIFVVANGDVLNAAVRLLIHQRVLGQFDRILEIITEKMGLRVLGGVRSLYTYEGHQVTDGNQLEYGQLYVAVGREKFKKLPYSDLLFTKPRGTRRVRGMKAHFLPPIYRFSKQSGESKSMARSSDSGDGESKASPPNCNGSSKENLSSIVREISQASLFSFRKRKSGQSFTLGTSDNDDAEPKVDEGNTDGKNPRDHIVEEKSDANLKAAEDESGKAAEKEESAPENTTEEDASSSKEDKEESMETNGEKEEEKRKEADDQSDEKGATEVGEEKVEEVKEEKKEEVKDGSKKEDKSEEQEAGSPNSDKTQENKEKEHGNHTSTEAEKEPDKSKDEDKQEEDSGGRGENGNDHVNDVDAGTEQNETENSNNPDKTESNNEKKEGEDGRSSISNSNQEEDSGNRQENGNDTVKDVDAGKEQKEAENSSDSDNTESNNETKEGEDGRSSISKSNKEGDGKESKQEATIESGEGEEKSKLNGEMSVGAHEVEMEAEMGKIGSASYKDVTVNGNNGDEQ
ncbi:uncharacterized protein PAE49_005653 [Odontesthes bonariensis]|uniref:uncharacterized protein LOC142380708 n=1 Tax=Odontesthes bonariensis TaxID=219752 RepID=UPI003F58334E